jgi:hypothetical protein
MKKMVMSADVSSASRFFCGRDARVSGEGIAPSSPAFLLEGEG